MSVMQNLATNFGYLEYPRTALVTIADLFLYFILTFNVGLARGKHKVNAPSTDGPAAFQRIFRIHMNTLEQMALNLPLLWIAAVSVGDPMASLFGLLWPIGRIVYAYDYYKDPKRRHRGFFIGLVSSGCLAILAIIGALASF